MEALWQDLRLAARSARRDLGLSAAAVLTLAIGFGMNVAVFSVVKSVLFERFPFAEQDRLVILWEQDVTRDAHLHEVSLPNFHDWRAESKAFDDMAAMGSTFWGPYRFAGDPEPFAGTVRAVSFSFFDVLGAKPALGRTFLPEDDAPGAPPVLVVSHRFWTRHLGGNASAVGRKLSPVGVDPVTVIGVMPREFDYPLGTDLWAPVGPSLADVAKKQKFTRAQERGLGVLFVVGRLNPAFALDEAESEMNRIVRRLHEEYSRDVTGNRTVHIVSLVDHVLGTTRRALLSLWGAVGSVMLLTCANVAGLLLVREAARAKENAIRLALGSGRRRLVRQMLTEVTLVAALGAGVGLSLARASLGLLVRLLPYEVPRLENAALDTKVVAFSLLLLALTVAVVVLALASRLTAGALFFLNDGMRSSTESPRGVGLRRLLVTGQIALALVLLLGAALMTRSFIHLLDLDLGFEPRNLLTFSVSLPDDRYPTLPMKHAFYAELLDRIASLPDVLATGAMNPRPFLHGQVGNDWTFYVEGQTPEARARNPRANGITVTPDYFSAIKIALLRGRAFTAQDDARAEPVIIVSESLARQAWPGEDPIGKRLCCNNGGERDRDWLTVVGLVENARYRDVYAPRLDLYLPYLQDRSSLPSFVVRTRSSPLEAVGALKAQVRALDRAVWVDEITTMDSVVASVFAPWRFNMVGFSLFAGVALGLSGLGLSSLLMFDVRSRTREMGVRLALGASASHILRVVFEQALGMVALGAGIGLLGGFALTRFVSSLLYDVRSEDPVSYAVAAAFLFATALVAVYVPARRATRVDAAVSLRRGS